MLHKFVKRSIDIVVASFILILLSPFFCLTALAIHLDSRGPTFYRGTRIGRNGSPFRILKFRTMYEIPESYEGPPITAHDDLRITPFGRWLRNTKLNELPQFWNVLVGEMSLVGPRPEDPAIAATWPRPVWDEILSVRPGITSPASVQYHSEERLLSNDNLLEKYIRDIVPDKVRMDQLYIRHQSLCLDLDTLLWTFLILLPQIGSYTPPEKLMFFGPITHAIRRYVNWFFVDLVIALLVVSAMGFVWRTQSPLNLGITNSVIAATGFALLFSIIASTSGVNRISWAKANFRDAYDLLPPAIVATLGAYLINNLLVIFPPTLILASSILTVFGVVVARLRNRLITDFLRRNSRIQHNLATTRERVLIVGSGRTAEHVAEVLRYPTYLNKFSIAGFIDDDLFTQGMRIYGAIVLGTPKEIPELVKTLDIGVVVVADHRFSDNDRERLRHSANHAKFIDVADVYGLFERLDEASTVPITVEDGICKVPDVSRPRAA